MEALGIDIGGTKTKIGLVHNEGKLREVKTFPTSAQKPQKLKRDLLKNIELYLKKNPGIRGIGIASAGRVSWQEKKVVYATDNLKNWARILIAEIIEDRFKLPVYIDNDVNAALLAELKVNPQLSRGTTIFLTIGTGLGGAVAINNQIIRGNTGSAGEFGHMILYPRGKQCNCGKKGCAEQYISGRAYQNRLKEKIKLSSKQLKPAYIQQQIFSKKEPYFSTLTEMLKDLALLLESIKNSIDFDNCIIGGGLSVYEDIIVNELNKHFQSYNHKYLYQPKFGIAKQKNNAGVLGGGLLVFRYHKFL